MDIKKFLVSAHGEGAASRVESLLNKTKGIEDILARDHMKVNQIALVVLYSCLYRTVHTIQNLDKVLSKVLLDRKDAGGCFSDEMPRVYSEQNIEL